MMNWRTQPMSGPPLTVLLGVRLLSFMFVWLTFGINIAEMSGMTNDWWFGNQIYVFHVGIFNAVIKVRRHKITLCFWLSRVTRRFSSSHWSIPWMSPGCRWYSTSTTHRTKFEIKGSKLPRFLKPNGSSRIDYHDTTSRAVVVMYLSWRIALLN